MISIVAILLVVISIVLLGVIFFVAIPFVEIPSLGPPATYQTNMLTAPSSNTVFWLWRARQLVDFTVSF